MTNANEKMNFLISNAKANVNLAAVCFQLIKSAPVDERPKLLEDFFVGYKSTPTTGELKLPITISDEEERKYMIRYGTIIFSIECRRLSHYMRCISQKETSKYN